MHSLTGVGARPRTARPSRSRSRIADAAGGVTDEAWANAAKHYDEDQFAALVCLIALMNTVNRVDVIVQQPPATTSPARSDYEEPSEYFRGST